jgi:hypothetical protein
MQEVDMRSLNGETALVTDTRSVEQDVRQGLERFGAIPHRR